MGTKYIIQARNTDGDVRGTLTRQTRQGAFEAADTLLSAFGENTDVTISWQMDGNMKNTPRGLFE